MGLQGMSNYNKVSDRRSVAGVGREAGVTSGGSSLKRMVRQVVVLKLHAN